VKIYYNGGAPDMTVSACPAGHLPAAECPAEWYEEDGKTPLTFPVHFRGGEAIVEAPLGRYLVAQNIARTTKIIMPGHVRRLAA
jgi:hypothetical protein